MIIYFIDLNFTVEPIKLIIQDMKSNEFNFILFLINFFTYLMGKKLENY